MAPARSFNRAGAFAALACAAFAALIALAGGADAQQQRQKADNAVRDLALEVERLNKQLKQAQLAASANSMFPPSGEIRPTGLAVTNPSTGSMMTTSAHPEQSDAIPVEITPPSEEE